MKIVNDKPVQLNDNLICVGIVRENGSNYAVIMDANFLNPVKIYVNEVSIPNDIIENIRNYEIENDDEFKTIIELLRTQTPFLQEEYLQSIKPGAQLMVYKYQNILSDLKLDPIKRIDDYIFLKAQEDAKHGYKDKLILPPDDCFKPILEYITQHSGDIHKEDYIKYYASLYVQYYKDTYMIHYGKEFKEKNDDN